MRAAVAQSAHADTTNVRSSLSDTYPVMDVEKENEIDGYWERIGIDVGGRKRLMCIGACAMRMKVMTT
jgi:hypothetical protein